MKYSAFLLFSFFLLTMTACGPTSSTNQPNTQGQDSIFRNDSEPPDSLKDIFGIVEPPKANPDSQTVKHLPRTEKWPYTSYKYAKAFGFNMRTTPGQTGPIIKDGKLKDGIYFENEVSEKDAKKVQDHVEKAQGTRILTKCAFMPRHAVVYFNEADEPVGSINICFSCEDMVAQPDIEIPEGEDKKEPFAGEDFDKLIPELSNALKYYKKLFKGYGMPTFEDQTYNTQYEKELIKRGLISQEEVDNSTKKH